MPVLGPAGSRGVQVLRLEAALHAHLEQQLLPSARAGGAAHRDTAAAKASAKAATEAHKTACAAGAAHRRAAAGEAQPPARKAAMSP